jgi:7-carboxy-7-deazaguanine synthase
VFGKNKILPVIKEKKDYLEVVEIFKTIQGEGIFSGHPAVFVRLGGCNLKCDFCDTAFDSFEAKPLFNIISEINALSNDVINLVVITGGEPLRQNISDFCAELLDLGYEVQIETNGTIKRKLPDEVHVVCSPKMVGDKYEIAQDLDEFVDAYKFVVRKEGKDYLDVPMLKTNKPIYVQPIDEHDESKNKVNQKYAMEIALENNYILSLQLHKVLGVR